MSESPKLFCTQCGSPVPPEAKFCPGCGAKTVAGPKPETQPSEARTEGVPAPGEPAPEPRPASDSPLDKELFRSWPGGLLAIGGLLAAAYFFFLFDTSVEVPVSKIFGETFGGGRVNNFGLMSQRQNGIIFSIGAAVVGTAIEIVARMRK